MVPEEPHLLLASGNPRKLIRNLSSVLAPDALQQLEAELKANVTQLAALAEDHLTAAKGLSRRMWRHRVSRFYYTAYALRRAVDLIHSGHYSTEVGDHKRGFPNDFPEQNTYSQWLADLREDRKMADYDHTACEDDLIQIQDDAEDLVTRLLEVARGYIKNRQGGSESQ